MRFHVLSLPHTQVTKEYCWCAYTSKVLRFCNMMTSLGHEVFLYAGTQNEAKVSEFISVVSEEDVKNWFGHYDWNRDVFDNWNPQAECWIKMNERAAREIAARKKPGDILGIISGACQYQVVQALPDMRAVEWGIGYEGVIRDSFHVFESYAWMHYVYGQQHLKEGRFFDAVIPNSFDEEDYIYSEKKDDYLLYLGRPIRQKGLPVIEELAKRGHKIIMAGQGKIEIPGVEHVGVVRGKEKAELLARARALLAPTFYIEPFGGVAIEAMLSGTPVLTTDFGAFTETVTDLKTGVKCHTIGEFEQAIEHLALFDPKVIRASSERYLTDNIRFDYDQYFHRLSLLDGAGWYS